MEDKKNVLEFCATLLLFYLGHSFIHLFIYIFFCHFFHIFFLSLQYGMTALL